MKKTNNIKATHFQLVGIMRLIMHIFHFYKFYNSCKTISQNPYFKNPCIWQIPTSNFSHYKFKYGLSWNPYIRKNPYI